MKLRVTYLIKVIRLDVFIQSKNFHCIFNVCGLLHEQ
jgi:hypothetical protein